MIAKIRDSLGYIIGFTFLLTFLFVFGLAFLYSSLKVTIENNASLAQKRAVLQAMGETFDPKSASEIERLYEGITIKYYKKMVVRDEVSFEPLESVTGEIAPTEADVIYYESIVNGKKVVGVTFSGSGMWGNITGVLSTNEDVSKTAGIQIISHSETPGLGARITSDAFRNPFYNGIELVNGTVHLVKNKKGDRPGEVNAITGASVTSSSMNVLLAEGYKDLKEIVRLNHEQ